MSIQRDCEHCQATLRIPGKYLGQEIQCPKCKATLLIHHDSPSGETPDVGVERPAESPPPDSAAVAAAGSPSKPPSDIRSALRVEDSEVAKEPPQARQPLVEPPKSPVGPPGIHKQLAIQDQPGSPFELDVQSKPSEFSAVRRPRGNPRRALYQGLIIGSVSILGVMGIVVLILLLSGPGAQPMGSVRLIWPKSERVGATMQVDGRPRAVPVDGEVRFELAGGGHRFILERPGYKRLNLGVEVVAGDLFELPLEWRPVSGVASVNTEPLIPGFAGWRQDFRRSQEVANNSGTDLLIVFGVSDADARTQRLARQVFAEDQFKDYVRGKLETVVIDIPATALGHGKLLDSSQNTELAQRYNIRSEDLPAQLLVDALGRPFAFDATPPDEISSYLKRIEKLRGNKDKRRAMFRASTEGDDLTRVKAAREAIEWLRDERLIPYYRREIQDWLSVAKRVDPKNGSGHLEQFFAADWQARLTATPKGRPEQVQKIVGELVSWTRNRKFSDAELALSLFLFGAFRMAELSNIDGATHLVDLAEEYAVGKPTLAKKLKTARELLADVRIRSNGSGFVIAPKTLITNYHVVEGNGRIEVQLKNGQRVPGEVLEADPRRDIALLKVEADVHWKPLPIDTRVRRGADVAAFGFPLANQVGMGLKLTTGVVSGVPEDSDEMLVLNCLINPGNSGGPVCNKSGAVIGMVTSKSISRNRSVDSYGMAIPGGVLLDFLRVHLPSFQNEPPPERSLNWAEVDESVSNSVLLILKLAS